MEYQLLSKEQNQLIHRFHSLPVRIDPEQIARTTWYLEFFIPFGVLADYIGPLSGLDKLEWRGNVYKCGDDTSHPHWGSWAPLTNLEFHAPADFGLLQFS